MYIHIKGPQKVSSWLNTGFSQCKVKLNDLIMRCKLLVGFFPAFLFMCAQSVYSQTHSLIPARETAIVYPIQNGKTLSGIRVGGICWAPVNLGACLTDKPDSLADSELFFGKHFVWPEKDPCPVGWRMPDAAELTCLEAAVQNGRGGFDYDRQSFWVLADDGNSKLILPAGGITGLNGMKRRVGLDGGLWSSSRSNGYIENFSTRLSFRGSSVSVGENDRRVGFNIRCVSAK